MPELYKKPVSGRLYYLDIMRAVACFCIVLTHSSFQFVLTDFGSVNYFIGTVLDGISQCGVPLFIMISGALLLDENYVCTKKKIIKHVIKMVIFFVFWSVFYCVVSNVMIAHFVNHEEISLFNVAESLIKGHYHLWYVFVIIGLYLLLPILRLWIKDKNKKIIEYFIIISFIFSFALPQIVTIGCKYHAIFKSLSYIINYLYLKGFGGYVTYFILGWYLNKYGVHNKKLVYSLGVSGLLITILGTYFYSLTTAITNNLFNYLYINILLYSVALFEFIKNKFIDIKKVNKIILLVSENSLGIYGVHIFFVDMCIMILQRIGLTGALTNIPIIFIMSFLASVILSQIFKMIPLLKKVV